MPVIEANGVNLFYELSGPTEAPIVAFSNSIGTTLAMWDTLVPALRGRYRILRYDTRGHGRSQVVDQPITIDDLADDLLGLLDALAIERVHLVGLSLGGMTAQALAGRAPERLASLTLMATAARAPNPGGFAERAKLVRAKGMAPIVDTVRRLWFTPEFLSSAPDKVAPVLETFAGIDPEGYAACCDAIGRMDLRPALGSVRAPTLVIAGRDDPATPVASAEQIAALIPQAELVVLPKAAHLLVIEQPEAAAAHLLAFLDRHRDSTRAPGAVAFEAGRKSVLGEAHVERSLAQAGAFAEPWQDFITRTAWGEIWGDARLPWKTRSFVTLAMMVALHREEEFKLHVRPALRNGVSASELQALLLQSAIYAGVPAANAGFRWAKDVLGDELAGDPAKNQGEETVR
ncbi:3-oxoadipate enol-lactonase [Bosea sp. F3-2]|uniref:bifunctional 3-oxoadipate enol-lactonase/4-carboxymuconolactone decarboxylase PcaDC n=1 Tax=Bosea sp. F3-2 TaxID=2599640 RepID=UPI0011ECBDB0|nr:3-oxoadipate enol-lactonase [Bosea sp. F3-2]QEL23473.1 3-oxoadipate enol-lactonase [Bosea sp. F3-2]